VYGARRIVLFRGGIAEVRQHPVADVTRHEPVPIRDDLGGAFLIAPHDLVQIFGIELVRQRRGLDEVAEHHGELTAFGHGIFRRRFARVREFYETEQG
jgi:hypothetical protein